MDAESFREKLDQYSKTAEQYLYQLSLEEKVALMSGSYSLLQAGFDMGVLGHYNNHPVIAGGNKRLHLPPVKFCDGPRGVVSRKSTCFPVAMMRGASFDVELEERIGEAIGKEVRAQGGNFFGGVCVNLLRHPAGGRGQETFGEDSFHVGQMAAALTRGVQKHNVIACVKHFAVNNQENTRFKIDVNCEDRTLREVYLPHFKEVIDAGAGCVMSAYNKFRGEYMGHNKPMLTELLKKEWGFSGFVVSDFVWGIRDTKKAANAGLDIEMCNTHWYGRRLVRAVKQGTVSQSAVDEAAFRILRTLLLFTETSDPLPAYPRELAASRDHTELAREAAEKSMVLLKNEGNLLPFNIKTMKTLAVIGRLANTANIGDHGSSRVHPPYVVTPLQGIRQIVGETVQVLYSSGRNIKKAVQIAASADAVIVLAGYTHKDEGEFNKAGPIVFGGDRSDLRLHTEDVALIKAITASNKKTAVGLVGSSAILMEEWKELVPAILHTFYAGMEGGTALAKLLFGQTNPSGKLPFSIPIDAKHLPEFDRNAASVHYEMYHGYTKLEKETHTPAFAFGYGLSYTTFELSAPIFEVKKDQVCASVEVKNTGSCSGEEVIQFYVGFENSCVDRPKKLLRGFKKVNLQPGENSRVTISCSLDKLNWYNPQLQRWELEKMVYQAYIGTSSRQEDLLKGEFVI